MIARCEQLFTEYSLCDTVTDSFLTFYKNPPKIQQIFKESIILFSARSLLK